MLYDDVVRIHRWTANTAGTGPGQAIMQPDGNFVVYDAQGTPLWFTETGGNAKARLVLQNDDNLVVYSSDGQAVWNRFSTAPAPSPRTETFNVVLPEFMNGPSVRVWTLPAGPGPLEITEAFAGEHTILLCLGPAQPGVPPYTHGGCFPLLGRPGTSTSFRVVSEETPPGPGLIFPNTLMLDISYNPNFPQAPEPTPRDRDHYLHATEVSSIGRRRDGRGVSGNRHDRLTFDPLMLLIGTPCYGDSF